MEARLLLEVLAAVSGRITTSSEIIAMVSLVPSPTHSTFSGIQDLVIYIYQLLDTGQSVSHPSGSITSPRTGTRKRVCVCILNNKHLPRPWEKRYGMGSVELQSKICKGGTLCTGRAFWGSGLPHAFCDCDVGLKPIHFAQLS